MGTKRLPTIRELPYNERPREKLIRQGTRALASRDLLALILGHGTTSLSALGLADQLLAAFDSLEGLADASVEELQTIQGVGEAKAARVCAAFEIGRRLVQRQHPQRNTVQCAADVADMFQNSMRDLDREEFHAVLLDTKHRVIGVHLISVGHLNGTLVHPREVFKKAIRRSSESIIVVHNHPSGDPTPSNEDIAVTRRLRSAGTLLGIELLDHIIVGGTRYVSLRQEGYFNDEHIIA